MAFPTTGCYSELYFLHRFTPPAGHYPSTSLCLCSEDGKSVLVHKMRFPDTGNRREFTKDLGLNYLQPAPRFSFPYTALRIFKKETNNITFMSQFPYRIGSCITPAQSDKPALSQRPEKRSRRKKMKRVLLSIVLIPVFLHTQEICGFLNNSVIIQNGEHIGSVGDEKWVIRDSRSGMKPVGKIKIKERFEDMVIADVVDVEPGYQITIGDQVVNRNKEMKSILLAEQRVAADSRYIKLDEPLIVHSKPDFRRLRLGVSLGTLLPYQTLYQRTNYSYQAGAVFQYGFTPRSSLLFDLMYSFMDERQRPGNEVGLNNQSVLNVNALFRQGVFHSIFMDLGAGVYMPSVSVSADTKSRKIDTPKYHYGVCAGLAINFIQSNSLSMFLNPRYHTYLMQDKLVENVSLGMNLIL